MSPPESDQAASPAKRTPRKAAARGKWSEERLLTSDKSELISHDLVKLFAKPEAWNVLEEREKREILALLPADTHPAADLTADDSNTILTPLPESFVRYSNNWRAGIRQFQIDLENGRYDPEWLREAESARQQREKGDFDSFKEREFEQFWGQKQKMDMRVLAGESGRIPLKDLVRAGVILAGDVWRYTFVFGKGADRFVVDKEVRIHEIIGSKLTFVIPTRTRTFLTSVHNGGHETKKPDQAMNGKKAETSAPEAIVSSRGDHRPPQEMAPPGDTKAEISPPIEEREAPVTLEISSQSPRANPDPEGQDNSRPVEVVIVSPKRDSATATDRHKRTIPQPVTESPAKRRRRRPDKVEPVEPEPEVVGATEPEAETNEPVNADAELIHPGTISPIKEVNEPQSPSQPPNTNESIMQATTNEAEQNRTADTPLSEPPEDLTPPSSQPAAMEPEEILEKSEKDLAKSDETPANNVPDEIIVPGIATPNMLVNKILQIDGRRKEGQRSANPWKEIRCYRKNQDMGSLWDVRQAWYFKQHPE